ncbi:MAG: T9SS type A sorting domain-containing protein, partial [Chitinophagales bacterium]|nr:T9SS type A sorting domain-containing protein [Chitinophagales bacterium]
EVASIIPPVISGLADTLVCAGDILTLTATGASTYVWTSDEAEIICAGTCETAEIIATTDATIEVIGTNDYGLSDTILFLVTALPVPEPPEIIITTEWITDIACLEIVDPDPALTYTWWSNGEIVSTEDTVCLSYGLNLTVVAENAAGCVSDTVEYDEWMHSLHDISLELIIDPNPVTDILYIRSDVFSGPTALIISDQTGRKVADIQKMEGQMEIDTSQWPAGIYYLRADGWQGAIQIVKQ